MDEITIYLNQGNCKNLSKKKKKAAVRRIPKFPSLTAEFQAVITLIPIRVTKPTACQNEALNNYSDIWASKSCYHH